MASISLRRRLRRRLHYWAAWRCAEPIVVFESDDWGMERRACSDFLRLYGEPSEWADEETESPGDLARLYEVLSHHCDIEGRSACFTANFVVANPDFDAIAGDGFSRYYDRPIGQNDLLKDYWLEGAKRKVFFPQYHARSHFCPEAWLRDLRSGVPGAREMFANRCFGGLSLLKGHGWRYHSEYSDWGTGTQPLNIDLLGWLKGGLGYFQQLFGFYPRSTIAPHYILTPATSEAWHSVGGLFVQGAGYRIMRRSNGGRKVVSHVLGERSPEGLLFMARTVKFEPRPERPNYGASAALRQIENCFRNHVPAIIDTHRINYTGRWRDDALHALESLLRALCSYGIRFLTSVELGEAISKSGYYNDVWTGETRRVTPLERPARKIIRAGFRRYNAFSMAKI